MLIDQICARIEQNREAMFNFLEGLVNIDSGADNPEGIKGVAQLIGQKLGTLGFSVEYLETPGVCTHMLAKKSGSGTKKVMVIGHMDTVFSKGTAAVRPFTIKEDRAYGPGVLDMKSGITIALYALEALHHLAWNEKEVTVFFCGDEETGHPQTDAPAIFTREALGKDAVFNMESGSNNGAVVIGRKGAYFPEIVVTGKSAHAGKDPEKGASAILELAHKTVDLHELTDYMAGITYNVGVVEGGTVPNAVPGHARALVDIRFVGIDQADKALGDFRSIADKIYVPGTSTLVKNERLMFLPMETTAGVRKLFEIVREQGLSLGIPEIKPAFAGGGSDSSWTVKAGAPTVCAMGGRGEMNHSEQEYIQLESLTERAKLLAMSILAV